MSSSTAPWAQAALLLLLLLLLQAMPTNAQQQAQQHLLLLLFLLLLLLLLLRLQPVHVNAQQARLRDTRKSNTKATPHSQRGAAKSVTKQGKPSAP